MQTGRQRNLFPSLAVVLLTIGSAGLAKADEPIKLNEGAAVNRQAAEQAVKKPALRLPQQSATDKSDEQQPDPQMHGGKLPTRDAVKERGLQPGQDAPVDRPELKSPQSPALKRLNPDQGGSTDTRGPQIKMPGERRGIGPESAPGAAKQLQEPGVPSAPAVPGGRLPVPEHDDGGTSDCDPSERGPGWAADCVRERAGGARISEIANYEDRHGCIQDPRTIELRGEGFGDRQGTRQALLTQTRRYRTRVHDLTPVEWRDDYIRLRVPPSYDRGVNYYVGIWTAAGEPVAPPKLMQFCEKDAVVSGTIELHNCSAGIDDVTVDIQVGDDRVEEDDLRPVPGNDFMWRYRHVVGLDPARSITEVRVTPNLPPGACAGEWQPRSAVLEVSARVREETQDFVYRVTEQELRIPARVVAGIIEGEFEGTEVRINNYAGRRVSGGSWHKAFDSSLKLSDSLGGHTEKFNIPEQRQGRRRFYVRDINLQDITVNTSAGAFELVMAFESGGPSELKGHCRVHGKAFGWRDCPVGSDKGAPDGQINHMEWRIRLTPARFRGDLAYDEVDVEVEADIQAGGICSRAGGAATTYTAGSPVPVPVDLCDVVGNYKDRIRNEASDMLTELLQLERTRRRVADGLRPTLNGRGIGEVRGAEISGGDLVIRYLPAASIADG